MSIEPIYVAIAAASLLMLLGFDAHRRRLSWNPRAPKLINGWLFVGCWDFWSRRVDFFYEYSSKTTTGNFGIMVGFMPVVFVTGESGRKIFFENSDIDFEEGYSRLLAGDPSGDAKGTQKQVNAQAAFRRAHLVSMLKRDRLGKVLPDLIYCAYSSLSDIQRKSCRLMDPFKDIYGIVFQLTLRMFACKDIAEDKSKLATLLSLYEMVASASTPMLVMYPWFPTLAMLKRLYAGGRIYAMFRTLIDSRRNAAHFEDDSLQVMIDDNADTLTVITFIISVLYAGLLNTGISSAWVLLYLAARPDWRRSVQTEVDRAMERHDPQISGDPASRLTKIPLEGWKHDFPVIDACLQESIRLNTTGAGFRKNNTKAYIEIGNGEVVPPDYFIAYVFGERHHCPTIYPDPKCWNPGRYVNHDGTPASGPGSTSKNIKSSFLGWGAGRHPCTGMEFAKLEMRVIVVLFVLMFDFELADPESGLPDIDTNKPTAHKPEKRVLLRISARDSREPGSVVTP